MKLIERDYLKELGVTLIFGSHPDDLLDDTFDYLIKNPGIPIDHKYVLKAHELNIEVINEADAKPGDFILAVLWAELPEDGDMKAPNVLVERSSFAATLTPEEENILALLMKQGWVERQVASIENTRMKYSGSDFKMTSQANHLSKLLSLLSEAQRESFHMQRLYKRRKLNKDGVYESNWSVLRERSVLGKI